MLFTAFAGQNTQQSCLHFKDAVGSFEGSLLDSLNVIPAQIQTLEIGQSVEKAKSWDP